jgi:hypothetical protein
MLQRALKVAREKLGDNDANTKRALQQLVQMKSKKKAMEEALGRLAGSAASRDRERHLENGGERDTEAAQRQRPAGPSNLSSNR